MNKLVLDISYCDPDIDLQEWINERDLWGVIIKAGGFEKKFGRYKDELFEKHYQAAKNAGLHIGYYYYSISRTIVDAELDANHFADLIDGKDWDLPCYIDVEDPSQFALTKRALTDVIHTFCDTLINRGYYAGLYTGGNAWLNNMYFEELLQYADWIAWWRANWPHEAGDIGMWQQGCGSIEGDIVYDDYGWNGYRDIDWCCVDYPSIISKWQNGNKNDKKAQSTSEIQNGSADSVISIAEKELGYYAPNDPERGSKYGRWMASITGEDWLAGPSSEIWWCCIFVSWVLNQANVVVKGFPSQNTDLALDGGARNYLVSDKNQIRRGDILIFDWNWDTDATDHIGFAKESPSGGYVATIEGNVGNAVQNKTRSLSTIRYVIRPQYTGASTVESSNDFPKNNKNGGKLDIDGSAGYNTILDWQDQLGTPCDGEISGQIYLNRKYFPAVNSVTWDDGGSLLVKQIQKKVGVYADGYWGQATSVGIQRWLQAHKYDIGPDGADGFFGTNSVKALQQSLNDGIWK